MELLFVFIQLLYGLVEHLFHFFGRCLACMSCEFQRFIEKPSYSVKVPLERDVNKCHLGLHHFLSSVL